MKVCLIQDFFRPYYSGGASIYVTKFADALAAAGHDVSVITTAPTGQRTISRETQGRLRVYRIPTRLPNIVVYTNQVTVFSRIWNVLLYWFNPWVYRAVGQVLAEIRPDIIHTHDTLYLSLAALVAARRSGTTWIHTCHYVHLIRPTGLRSRPGRLRPEFGIWRLFWPITRSIVRSPRTIVGPSSFVLGIHRTHQFFPDSLIEVVPHGVPNPCPPTTTRDQQHLRVLTVSRLSAEKGVDYLIEAFHRLTDQRATLTICGSGPERRRLQQRAEGDPRIIFKTTQEASVLCDLYARSNLFVAPSIAYETFNLTIAEAIQSGLPVLATNIGAHPELVQPEYGRLIPPGDVNALKAALSEYSASPDLRRQQSEAAYREADRFRLSDNIDRVLDIYSLYVTETSRPKSISGKLVSIILPCYNYGRYVREALDSCLAQTYPNLELIVINDGSTDDSRDIIQNYLAAHPKARITFIDNPTNLGTCQTFNLGVRASRGEYYAIVDADDILEPSFIRTAVEYLERHPDAGYVYTDVRLFGNQRSVSQSRPFNSDKLLDSNYINVAALTKRSVFDQIGGFNERLSKYGFEDWEFRLACLESGITGLYLPRALYRYRIHGSGRNVIPRMKMWRLTFRVWSLHPKLYTPWVRISLLGRKIFRQLI